MALCETSTSFVTDIIFNGQKLVHVPKKTEIDVGGYISGDGVMDSRGRYHAVSDIMPSEVTTSVANDSTYNRALLEGCGDLEVYYSNGTSYLITDASLSESPKLKDGEATVELKFKGSVAEIR